jgi:putative zinc finger/helix-turn-helix YgiT family protein
MKCRECGGEAALRPGPFHFTSSGLDNVYLKGEGVQVYVCAGCGEETVEIHAMGKLLDKIGEAVANKPDRLEGQEIRFLRKHMRMKAREMAEVLGIDPSSLSRVESGADAVSKQIDRMVRLIYRHADERELLSSLTGERREGSRYDANVRIEDGPEVVYA